MANNIHPATSHTGGGVGALDAIDGNDIADGDGVLVITDNNADHYVVDGSSSESESYPRIIAPDTNPGTKRYKRVHCRDNYLYSRKTSADTPDDEFESTTLDGKWTAVGSIASGTVDLLETGAVNKYDLTTRPGWLLIQQGATSSGTLRQDHTLADGASIIVAMSVGTGFDSAIANNQINVGISLNDNDAGYNSGNYLNAYIDTENYECVLKSYNDVTAVLSSEGIVFGQTIYFRVARSGLVYYIFYSLDGCSWCGLGSDTAGSAYDNIWLFMTTTSNPTPAAIGAFNWIRQGTNSLDPWGI